MSRPKYWGLSLREKKWLWKKKERGELTFSNKQGRWREISKYTRHVASILKVEQDIAEDILWKWTWSKRENIQEIAR
jgi:hypothetical protein